jgi:hypothetical protein
MLEAWVVVKRRPGIVPGRQDQKTSDSRLDSEANVSRLLVAKDSQQYLTLLAKDADQILRLAGCFLFNRGISKHHRFDIHTHPDGSCPGMNLLGAPVIA